MSPVTEWLILLYPKVKIAVLRRDALLKHDPLRTSVLRVYFTYLFIYLLTYLPKTAVENCTGEFLMKSFSVCVGEAGIPTTKTHIIGRTAANVLAVTS